MTTYEYSNQQAQQARREAFAAAPKECPYCLRNRAQHTPINQRFELRGTDGPRQHCGSDPCRNAYSRESIAARLAQARTDARAHILNWCNTHCTNEQRATIMTMTSHVLGYNPKEGHLVAEAALQVLEDLRCKHERITELETNARLWQLRAEATERQYKERIAQLEAELSLFTGLHNTIHGIAADQLAKQPDPEQRAALAPYQEHNHRENPDREYTEAVLAGAGIRSLASMSRAELEAAANGNGTSGGWLPSDGAEEEEE